jgi:hypothetical protein
LNEPSKLSRDPAPMTRLEGQYKIAAPFLSH